MTTEERLDDHEERLRAVETDRATWQAHRDMEGRMRAMELADAKSKGGLAVLVFIAATVGGVLAKWLVS